VVYNAEVALQAKRQNLAEKQFEMDNDPSRIFLKSLASSGGQSVAQTLGSMAVGAAKYKLFGGERTLQEAERKNKETELQARKTLGETIRSNKVTEDRKLSTEERQRVEGYTKPFIDKNKDLLGLIGLGKATVEQIEALRQQLLDAEIKLVKDGATPREMSLFRNQTETVRNQISKSKLGQAASRVVGAGGKVINVGGAAPADPASTAKRNTTLYENLEANYAALNQEIKKLEGQRSNLEGAGVNFDPDGKPDLGPYLDEYGLQKGNEYLDNWNRVNAQQKAFNKDARMVQELPMSVLPFSLMQNELGDYTLRKGIGEIDDLDRVVDRETAQVFNSIQANDFTFFRDAIKNSTMEELAQLGLRDEFLPNLSNEKRKAKFSSIWEVAIVDGRVVDQSVKEKLINFIRGKSSSRLKQAGLKPLKKQTIPESRLDEVNRALEDPSQVAKMITARLKAENLMPDAPAGPYGKLDDELAIYYAAFPEEARNDMFYVLNETPMGVSQAERAAYIKTNWSTFVGSMKEGVAVEADMLDKVKKYIEDEEKAKAVANVLFKAKSKSPQFETSLGDDIYAVMNSFQESTGYFDYSGFGDNSKFKKAIETNPSLGFFTPDALGRLSDDQILNAEKNKLLDPELMLIFKQIRQ